MTTTNDQQPEQPEPATIRDELTVIRRITTALDTLHDRAQRRVVTYIADRYDLHDQHTPEAR